MYGVKISSPEEVFFFFFEFEFIHPSLLTTSVMLQVATVWSSGNYVDGYVICQGVYYT